MHVFAPWLIFQLSEANIQINNSALLYSGASFSQKKEINLLQKCVFGLIYNPRSTYLTLVSCTNPSFPTGIIWNFGIFWNFWNFGNFLENGILKNHFGIH